MSLWLKVFTEKAVEVVQVSVYDNLLEFQSSCSETPEIDNAFLEAGANGVKAKTLKEMKAVGAPFYRPGRADFPRRRRLSSGHNGIDMSVVNSFITSNGVAVSTSLNCKTIKDRLGAKFGINYSHTWTTQATVTVRGNVGRGETGVFITRPWTNRKHERVFQDCVDSMR
ncbi:Ff.00g018140.m01.CDS01 [Fusarium sp. VM40]|nr:Ff.00g018140.m01.CDS01 [Fusarium sp. VM40]